VVSTNALSLLLLNRAGDHLGNYSLVAVSHNPSLAVYVGSFANVKGQTTKPGVEPSREARILMLWKTAEIVGEWLRPGLKKF